MVGSRRQILIAPVHCSAQSDTGLSRQAVDIRGYSRGIGSILRGMKGWCLGFAAMVPFPCSGALEMCNIGVVIVGLLTMWCFQGRVIIGDVISVLSSLWTALGKWG